MIGVGEREKKKISREREKEIQICYLIFILFNVFKKMQGKSMKIIFVINSRFNFVPRCVQLQLTMHVGIAAYGGSCRPSFWSNICDTCIQKKN